MKTVFYGLTMSVALVNGAFAAETAPIGISNHTIAYATYQLHYAQYQTPDGKQECPDGMNSNGPREEFNRQFPSGGTVADTELRFDAEKYFPRDSVSDASYHTVKGKIGFGLNLDGKAGPNDLTSPEGEKGIDNQLYRVLGCSYMFRGPAANFYKKADENVKKFEYNRTLIEITKVDNLENDPEVDVAFYRGLDPLHLDATSEHAVPGGSQRIDERYGKSFERHFKGKIVNGILTTEPIDIKWPWGFTGTTYPKPLHFQDARFSLNLMNGEATGYFAGYADVDDWYQHLMTYSSSFSEIGQLYPPGMYRALRENADAKPDGNGVNTAISYAMEIKMTQVMIVRPNTNVATNGQNQSKQTAASLR